MSSKIDPTDYGHCPKCKSVIHFDERSEDGCMECPKQVMKSKIEITRDLGERLLNPEVLYEAEEELRALLAAPVVEHQSATCSCPSGDGSLRHPCLVHHKHEWDINEHGTASVCSICGIQTSDVVPELDELQADVDYVHNVPDDCDRIIWHGSYHSLPIKNVVPAGAQTTIANLTTDLKVTKQALGSLKGECLELQATVARLTAENERLKGEASPISELEILRATNKQLEEFRDKVVEERLKAGQGEPVAWANWKVGSRSYVPFRRNDEAQRSVNASEISATQNGPYKVVPLYTSQPAPVAAVLPERLQEIHAFLDGSGTLDGYSFGSFHPSKRKYWWRNELRACLDKVKELNP